MINWAVERALIAEASALHHVDPDFIESIRAVENGDPGREFGALSEPVEDYDAQLHAACAAVAHRLAECPFNPLTWYAGKSRYRREFVRWLSGKWAPAGAEFNPEGVIMTWLRKTWHAYETRIIVE